MKDLEKRIKAIEERNSRVELDKSWETSWTRRLTIASMTYIIAAGYFAVINNDRPLFNALVPAGGYFLSTLVVGKVRKIWEK